jgi:phosphate transport system permease protein
MDIYKLRRIKDRLISIWIKSMTILVLLLPVILFVSLFNKSWLILEHNGLADLLFSSVWRPMAGEFGFWPFIISSLWVTFLGLVLAAPICLLSAIYLTHYAPARLLRTMQPVIDILAGIPSVIYGVWGILLIVPAVGGYVAPWFGIESSGFSILAGGFVLSVMLIPFILNILIEIFKTLPRDLFEASLSLGASHWHSVKHVLLRKSAPGIVSAFVLGLSRAFGETIAVLMVVGNVVGIPTNIFDPGYPLPALIANNYGEMLSIPMYDSALMFAALLLMVVVILFNLLGRMTINYYETRMN